MSLQVDGVDFFTAIYTQNGEFVCWYYTPEGEELIKSLDTCNKKYNLVDLTIQRMHKFGLSVPQDYKPPTLPVFNVDCEVPPYTDEQVFQMNLLKGIDDLIEKLVVLPIVGFAHDGGIDYPTVKSVSAIEAVVQFKEDYLAGKIA